MLHLQARLETLHDEIVKTPDSARDELLDHLEQAVLTLETHGVSAPHWAKVYLAARVDVEVEAQFDNMPF